MEKASTVSRPVILHNFMYDLPVECDETDIFPLTGAVEHSKRNRTRARFCCTMDHYNLREADGEGFRGRRHGEEAKAIQFSQEEFAHGRVAARTRVIKTSLTLKPRETNTK